MVLSTTEAASEYLNNHSVLCLATTRGSQPWVSPVFYALWGEKLVFLSAPHTRHARNLVENSRVSASVQEDYHNWQEIKGVQLEGVAQLVSDQHISEVVQCYSRKFPVTGDQAPPEIASAIDKIKWYQLQPSLIYFIDNSVGLGYREQIYPVPADP